MMGTGVSSGEHRARLAAEAAIASPLLEDVDLTGAKGVLVNITSGLDLSIGEFEEVGEVVREITSDSATVVVGTVIDPDLRDEVRVTVIVTGLGRKQGTATTLKLPSLEHVKTGDNLSHIDYGQLDKPAINRRYADTKGPEPIPAPAMQYQQPQQFQTVTPPPAQPLPSQPAPVYNHGHNQNQPPQTITRSMPPAENLHDIDYLDIPAFLRKREEEEA